MTVHVSDVARREWVTRMQAQFVNKVKDAIKQSRALARHPLLPDLRYADQLRELAAAKDDLIEDARAVSSQCCERLLDRLQANVHPIRPEDGAVVLDGYFAGTHPFNDVKARNDFPDAFILQALKRLSQIGIREVLGITADARLGKAFSTVRGVTHYKSMKDLLASPVVQAANAVLPLAQLWTVEREHKVIEELKTRTAFFQSAMQSRAENELFQNTASGSIPEDSGEATITGVGEIANLCFDWDNCDHLGPGWLGVRFSFECEADLEFKVYRADSFHVPDWVHVDFGDFEEDHYFDTSGCRTIRVEGQLTIQFTIEELQEAVLPNPNDIEIYDFDSITVDDEDDEEEYEDYV